MTGQRAARRKNSPRQWGRPSGRAPREICPAILTHPHWGGDCTTTMRWQDVGAETGRVDRLVGSRFYDVEIRDSTRSRFYDRPVKPVEKPVEFSFLATKRHLSTNRNILIYFIINKTFYKKSVLTNHIFRKHLLNGFKL